MAMVAADMPSADPRDDTAAIVEEKSSSSEPVSEDFGPVAIDNIEGGPVEGGPVEGGAPKAKKKKKRSGKKKVGGAAAAEGSSAEGGAAQGGAAEEPQLPPSRPGANTIAIVTDRRYRGAMLWRMASECVHPPAGGKSSKLDTFLPLGK